jgi:hypothetical protein
VLSQKSEGFAVLSGFHKVDDFFAQDYPWLDAFQVASRHLHDQL